MLCAKTVDPWIPDHPWTPGATHVIRAGKIIHAGVFAGKFLQECRNPHERQRNYRRYTGSSATSSAAAQWQRNARTVSAWKIS